jgi:hypothetical protein
VRYLIEIIINIYLIILNYINFNYYKFIYIFLAMRRRFEKRVYISLPEASARTVMFKLNIGDS